MPTTRSGAHYGLETKRQAKGKVAVQTYAKAKPQPSKIKLSTVEVKQDAGKKRAVQYYKKPPVKASVTRVQKISKVQAAKRKESIDNRRFIGSPRVQPDGADYPVLPANMTWKQCAELPTGLSNGKTTVIDGKVYCGGVTDDDNDEYIVYCYHPPQDKWTTLPPAPVRYFGLGQVNGKLVAVGGRKKNNAQIADEVYTYSKQSQAQKWKQIIPPMPMARWFPDVLSLQSALIVAGGCVSLVPASCTTAVEIFNPDTSQWYRTDSLPTVCMPRIIAIGISCYVLGGYSCPLYINQALYTSVDDLFGNAVPANQTTHSGSSDTQSAWKALPNTPTYGPAAAVLAGNLLVIGGKENHASVSPDKKEVYMYSPSTNSWIYISDLPAPRSTIAVAVLSSTEILVIGGWGGGYPGARLSTVYKGITHFKL